MPTPKVRQLALQERPPFLRETTRPRLHDRGNGTKAVDLALQLRKRPTMTVVFPTISPEVIGQFFYLYETAVSYMGTLLEINTYDQPAVQLGKDATYALMGKPGYEELNKKIQAVAKRDKKYLI